MFNTRISAKVACSRLHGQLQSCIQIWEPGLKHNHSKCHRFSKSPASRPKILMAFGQLRSRESESPKIRTQLGPRSLVGDKKSCAWADRRIDCTQSLAHLARSSISITERKERDCGSLTGEGPELRNRNVISSWTAGSDLAKSYNITITCRLANCSADADHTNLEVRRKKDLRVVNVGTWIFRFITDMSP